MKFNSIYKYLSIALLIVGMSQAVFAMNKKNADIQLRIAVRMEDRALIQKYLEQGADINSLYDPITSVRLTPLHYAIAFNNVESIKELLQYEDLNFDCKNFSGETALEVAKKLKRDIIEQFIVQAIENREEIKKHREYQGLCNERLITFLNRNNVMNIASIQQLHGHRI